MTPLFEMMTSLVEELSSLHPEGIYTMGEFVAVPLNKKPRNKSSNVRPASRTNDDHTDSPRADDSKQDHTAHDAPPEDWTKQRPAGAPWDAVLLTGVGLPDNDIIASLSSQLRPQARLALLVTFTVPTDIDATDLARSWLDMDLDLTALVPAPTAMLALARRLSIPDSMRRQGRLALADQRKTEWTQAEGHCMKPEINDKDEIFVQFGVTPTIGDVALIQTPDTTVAHRIIARVGINGASYVVQAGDNSSVTISPEWAILGRVTAVRTPGDDSPRILPNRPQPLTRIFIDLARLALPDSSTMAGKILRSAFHAAQRIVALAQKLDAARRGATGHGQHDPKDKKSSGHPDWSSPPEQLDDDQHRGDKQ